MNTTVPTINELMDLVREAIEADPRSVAALLAVSAHIAMDVASDLPDNLGAARAGDEWSRVISRIAEIREQAA